MSQHPANEFAAKVLDCLPLFLMNPATDVARMGKSAAQAVC
jgi:hypothetical protein